jgi:hypothetical protein
MIAFEGRIDAKDTITLNGSLNIMEENCHDGYISSDESGQQVLVKKYLV